MIGTAPFFMSETRPLSLGTSHSLYRSCRGTSKYAKGTGCDAAPFNQFFEEAGSSQPTLMWLTSELRRVHGICRIWPFDCSTKSGLDWASGPAMSEMVRDRMSRLQNTKKILSCLGFKRRKKDDFVSIA